MKHHAIVLFFCLFITTAIGQIRLEGKVIDNQTKEPLAFANLVVKSTVTNHFLTDVDGKFSLDLSTLPTSLDCSFVGFESKHIEFVGSINFPLTVELLQSENALEELVIPPGVNPANAIIQKAIENRKTNNPENLNSFRYKAYNKIVYEYGSGENKTDSISLSAKFKSGQLFIMECATERKFLKPDFSEERVIGTKVSGFTNPEFAMLATDVQPFSFYSENIKLFDLQYLNPISKGSLNKYKFHLENSIVNATDTTYIISFKPLPNKNFEGLTGLLYINSNQYAIQNVIAAPFAKQKIDIKIQQQYSLTNGHWFPNQLNFVLSITNLKKIKIIIDGKSYISDVTINNPIHRRDFALQSVVVEENSGRKDSVFWNEKRNQPLNLREQQTYQIIDSIGKARHFDRYVEYMEAILQNRFPLKYIDIDHDKTLLYNEYEGLRLGTGFFTNDRISKRFKIGGFYGYGIKDERSKYGGKAIITINKKAEADIFAGYQDNYIEIGNYGLRNDGDDFFNYRRFLGFQYDRVVQKTVGFHVRMLKYFQFSIAANQTKTFPKYHYNNDVPGFLTTYKNTDASIKLRFAYKEKIVSVFQQNVASGSKYPVLSLFFSRGFKNFLDGDLAYNKWETKIEQSFFTKNLGQTNYQLEAGIIDRNIPYGLLFTGEGSAADGSIFINKNYFQTMKPYEFISDQYANLFLSHNFGGLLFKSGNFQPSLIIHHNMGWGDLADKNLYPEIKRKDKIFTEAGIQLDNLIKMNYLNIANIGFGTAIFCRYSAYANTDLKDNLFFKFTLNLTIK